MPRRLLRVSEWSSAIRSGYRAGPRLALTSGLSFERDAVTIGSFGRMSHWAAGLQSFVWIQIPPVRQSFDFHASPRTGLALAECTAGTGFNFLFISGERTVCAGPRPR
jgi:hypothetical protein